MILVQVNEEFRLVLLNSVFESRVELDEKALVARDHLILLGSICIFCLPTFLLFITIHPLFFEHGKGIQIALYSTRNV